MNALAAIRADMRRSDERLASLEAQVQQVTQRVGQSAENLSRTALDPIRAGLDALRNDTRSRNQHVNHYLPRRRYESFDVAFFARVRAAMGSADYFSQHLYSKPVFDSSDDLIRHCLGLLGPQVRLPLEFGVFSGRSINLIAEIVGPEVTVWGFDSFEGLPEAWRSEFQQGHFARADLPEVRDNVRLVKGWFNETLPGFRRDVVGQGLTNFIHMDCDLYSSTRTVFEELEPHITPDAIVVFDEFFNYPGWEQHEIKALEEFVARTGRRFEFIGSVPIHQQVAIRFLP